MTMLDFLSLFPEFEAPSWGPWRAVLSRLTDAIRALFWIIGRGAGKSRMCALVLVFCAVAKKYKRVAGEHIYAGLFAPDRKQAAITFRYALGFIKSVPTFAAMIVREGADSVELNNGVIIEVITASTSAPRGRSYCVAIVEEASFLPNDESADPDIELLRALRPALARVPGSLLCVIGSPYARRGVMYEAWQKYHEGAPADVMFLNAPTLDLNPSFDRTAIAKAYEEDPSSAAAEFGGHFRSDVAGFITREAVEAVTIKGRIELPFIASTRYAAFVDFAGGTVGGDSFTAAVSHTDFGSGRQVLDAVREIRPPFSPETAVLEIVTFLKGYGIRRAIGDRWGGEFPREMCRRHGIVYELSERTKSEIYLAALPLLNSGRVELLDNSRLLAQINGLERRTARGGRDSVDHGPGQRDDAANAALGALTLDGKSLGAGITGFDYTTGVITDGWVGGMEYHRGRPWNGIMPPDRDRKGRAINQPVRFVNGAVVEQLPYAPSGLLSQWYIEEPGLSGIVPIGLG